MIFIITVRPTACWTLLGYFSHLLGTSFRKCMHDFH